jgi:hypothetical protein
VSTNQKVDARAALIGPVSQPGRPERLERSGRGVRRQAGVATTVSPDPNVMRTRCAVGVAKADGSGPVDGPRYHGRAILQTLSFCASRRAAGEPGTAAHHPGINPSSGVMLRARVDQCSGKLSCCVDSLGCVSTVAAASTANRIVGVVVPATRLGSRRAFQKGRDHAHVEVQLAFDSARGRPQGTDC